MSLHCRFICRCHGNCLKVVLQQSAQSLTRTWVLFPRSAPAFVAMTTTDASSRELGWRKPVRCIIPRRKKQETGFDWWKRRWDSLGVRNGILLSVRHLLGCEDGGQARDEDVNALAPTSSGSVVISVCYTCPTHNRPHALSGSHYHFRHISTKDCISQITFVLILLWTTTKGI